MEILVDFLESNSYPLWFNATQQNFSTAPVYLTTCLIPLIAAFVLLISVIVGFVTKVVQKSNEFGKHDLQFNLHWTAIIVYLFYVLLFTLSWFALRTQDSEIPKIANLETVIEISTCILATVELCVCQKFGLRSSPACIVYFSFRTLWLFLEVTLYVTIVKFHGFEDQPFPFSLRFNLLLPLDCLVTLLNLACFLKQSGNDYKDNDNVLSFQNISFQSKILFHWFTRFVIKAWRGHLTFDWLPNLSLSFTSLPTTTSFSLNMERLKQQKLQNQQDFVVTHWELYKIMMIRTFGWYMVKTGSLRLMGDSIQFSSPILLSLLISHIEQPDTPQWKGVLLCILLFLCLCVESLIKLRYQNSMHQTGLMMKAAITDYAYQKTTRIMSGTSAANIVNALRLDCECFGYLNKQIHLIWSNPFTVTICIYLLYIQLKAAAFVGLIVVALITVLNVFTLFLVQRQMEISRHIKDEKLSLVNEVVTSIKQIKFYLLEKAFHHSINEARKRELFAYNKTQVLILIVSASLELSPTVIGIACISSYLIMYPNLGLSAGQLFVSLSVLNVLKVPLYSVSDVITSLQESNILCKRLAKFLNVQEIDRNLYLTYLKESDVMIDNCCFKYFNDQISPKKRKVRARNESEVNSGANNGIKPDENENNQSDSTNQKNSSQSDSSNASEENLEETIIENQENTKGEVFFLQDINLKVKPGSLVAVIGAVKSGKSSLLAAIGGEMEIIPSWDGSVGSLKRKRVSWDLQNFMFIPSSVQNNIILGDGYNLEKANWDRYRKVIYSCALFPDIPTLEEGDQTELLDVSNLSGGQQKRISLARACYFEADVYLFDDPLAHMDALSSKHVFDHVLSHQGMLRNKTRIAVTNDLRFLDQFDHVVFLENGKILSQGTYAEVVRLGGDRFEALVKNSLDTERDGTDGGTGVGSRNCSVWKIQMDRYFQQPPHIEHPTREGGLEFCYRSVELLKLKLEEQRNQINMLMTQNKIDRRSSEQLREPIMRRISISEKATSSPIKGRKFPGNNSCNSLADTNKVLSPSPATKGLKFQFPVSASKEDVSLTASGGDRQRKVSGGSAIRVFIGDSPLMVDKNKNRTRNESAVSNFSGCIPEEDDFNSDDIDYERRESKVSVFEPTPQAIRKLRKTNGVSETGYAKLKPGKTEYEDIELVRMNSKNGKVPRSKNEDEEEIGQIESDSEDGAFSVKKDRSKVSKNWLKSVAVWTQGAGMFLFTFWQFAALAYVAMEVWGAVLLKKWAIADANAKAVNVGRNDSDSVPDDNHNIHYFTRYCAIKLGNVAFICLRSLMQIIACYKASMYFNEKIVQALLGCELGAFQKLKRETILQRFTIDMMRVDVFGFKVFFSLSAFYELLALSVVIVYNIPSFAFIIFGMFAVYILIERLYVRVRKQLVRIKQGQTEIELFGIFERTTSMLIQIRTFDLQKPSCDLLRNKLDSDLKIAYYILAAQKWLILRLYTLGNILITATSIYCVFQRHDAKDVGLIGIVVNMALQMNMALFKFINIIGDVESETARVENLREFMRVKQEEGGYSDNFCIPAGKKTRLLTETWPERGVITLKNVTASYQPIKLTREETNQSETNNVQTAEESLNNDSNTFVLNNLNLEISPSQRTAIVGRSNSGKSSLVLALTRLIYLHPDSKILIDRVNIANVPLYRLRKAITVIPQNVLLFKDTLLYNLDPMHVHKRDRMFEVLQLLGILEWPELRDKRGDDLWNFDCEKFKNEGAKQLIGLARGLLNKTKIVILDECTAQLDVETEKRVESVLEKELEGCTVIKIAHRINTVIDYDKVIVMQYGQAMEGNPRELLERKNNLFYELWRVSTSPGSQKS